MTPPVAKPRRCPLCSGAAGRIEEAGGSPHRVITCRRCDLTYVDPQPSPDAIREHYGAEYYREWITRQLPRRRRMWDARLRRIQAMRRPGRLLDIGCGDGLFLEAALRQGWAVEGTEVSPFAARLAAERIRREVFCGEIWEAPFSPASFDVVTLWHVLEHVRRPLAVLQAAQRMLRPGGLLFVAVPNRDDRLLQTAYRIRKGRWPERFSPHQKELHLFHFTVSTLKAMLFRASFRTLRVGVDGGMVDPALKVLNVVGAALYRIAGLKIFLTIEAVAVPLEPPG